MAGLTVSDDVVELPDLDAPDLSDLDQVRTELQATAQAVSNMFAIDSGSSLRVVVEMLASEELASEYFAWSSLVRRFIAAELDIAAPSERGMGRLTDKDPPPRLGAKYRDQLRDPEARAAVAIAAERSALGGFAAHTALYRHTPATGLVSERVWARFLRRLSASYGEAAEAFTRSTRGKPTEENLFAVLTVVIADRGLSPLIEAFQRYGIMRTGRLARVRNARPATYGALFVGAGVSLRYAGSAAADDELGADVSIKVLEEYESPRRLRDVR